jgi:CRP-like cAMP-binding protein
MAEPELEDAIREHPFTKGLCQRYLQILADCALFTQFDAGQIIFHESEVANRFYLIRKGKVLLESRTPGGQVLITMALGPGEALGWSWLFPPYYWRFDARAWEPTQAILFFGTRLRERSEQDRAFGYELMKRFAAVLAYRLDSCSQCFLGGGSSQASHSDSFEI